MLNQAVVVGRITHLDNNEVDKELVISVLIPNPNEEDKKEIIACTVKAKNMIENILSYIEVGDLVGFRGRLTTGNKFMVEKTTFLSTKKKEDLDASN